MSSEDGERLLAGHRAYISVLFCDLRGFTAFTETAAPEELFELLRDYHALIGELIAEHDGTLEHFAGDGVMVFFNDPAPVDEHELQAIRMALALQERFAELAAAVAQARHRARARDRHRRRLRDARPDRLRGPLRLRRARPGRPTSPHGSARTPKAGQTLISQRVLAAVEDAVDAQPVGELELKGFARPVAAYEVRALRAS